MRILQSTYISPVISEKGGYAATRAERAANHLTENPQNIQKREGMPDAYLFILDFAHG
jgi:hypothetical protein